MHLKMYAAGKISAIVEALYINDGRRWSAVMMQQLQGSIQVWAQPMRHDDRV